jgi:hypothetical protein
MRDLDWRPSIDPPLLPGEVEIDVSGLGDHPEPGDSERDVDPLATSRGDARGVASRLRVERMIAAARAAGRGGRGER